MTRFRICRGYIAYEDERYGKIHDLPDDEEPSIWNRDPIPCSSTNKVTVDLLVRQHFIDHKLYLGFVLHSLDQYRVWRKSFVGLETTSLALGDSMKRIECGCSTFTQQVHDDVFPQPYISQNDTLSLESTSQRTQSIPETKPMAVEVQEPRFFVDMHDLRSAAYILRRNGTQSRSFVLVDHKKFEKPCTVYCSDVETLTLLWLQLLQNGLGVIFKDLNKRSLQACSKPCSQCYFRHIIGARLGQDFGVESSETMNVRDPPAKAAVDIKWWKDVDIERCTQNPECCSSHSSSSECSL